MRVGLRFILPTSISSRTGRVSGANAKSLHHLYQPKMAKVLRGGKWGNAQPRSASNADHGQEHETAVENEREEADDVQQLFLCFVEERKQIGVAGYDASTNEVYVSKVSAGDDYAYARRITSSLDKCHVVLPASYKVNDKLIRALSKATVSSPDQQANEVTRSRDGSESDASGSGDASSQSVSLSHLPNHDFGLGRAAELCSLITVLGMPEDLQPEERIVFLSHVLQDDSSVMRAVGGLLSFIIGNGIFGSLMRDDDSIYLNAICYRNYGDVLMISNTTLRALHVFTQDTHPVGRGSLRGKEGFSLYGIIKSYTTTLAGRKLLRVWLQYPSTDLDTIQQRQFLVDVMKGSTNRAFLATIKESLRGIKSVPAILTRLKQVRADVGDWKALYSSAKSFVAILETLKVATQQNEALLQSSFISGAMQVTEPHLRDTVNWLDAVADFEESSIQGRMIVAPGFSDEIDELKRSYAALDNFLTKIGVEELNSLVRRTGTAHIESLNATYEPQIGFLLAFSEEECERLGQGVLEEQGLSFVFKSEEQRYFKNERCRELDDEPGDIHGRICDLETKAFRYLVTKLLECSPSLLEMFRFVTDLDCLQALACVAAEYGWVRPSLSDESADLEIEDGRHPLLELTVPSFVPNSTKMRSGDVHIVTGPNYSGKSVYLSQVALIVILAQAGSFVPATKARIGLIGAINSRISSFESVTFGQSSFFADAAQIASMLSRAPKRSLNLIDEFGKGTLEVDGMALLISALRAFLRMNESEAPFTICATHFIEILKEPFLPLDSRRLGLYSMEIMTKDVAKTINSARGSIMRPASSMTRSGTASRADSRKADVPGKREARPDDLEGMSTVVKTYRLLSGSICNESRALQCALEVGVDRSLLERAAHIRPAIASDGRIENAVANSSNNPRIKELTRAVKEFKSTSPSPGMD